MQRKSEPITRTDITDDAVRSDLHSNVVLPSIMTAVQGDPLERDFHSMVGGKWIDNIKTGSAKAKTVIGDGTTAVGKVLGSLGDITKLSISKTTNNKSAITILSGLGAVFSGIFSLKNIVKTGKTFIDPKSDNSPWLVHALMSVLQGGLSFGLAAPFTGMRNPFMQEINGQNVVPLKMILGAFVGLLGVKVYKDSASGVGIPVKIPIVGNQIKEIASTTNEALKAVSTNTENPTEAGPGAFNPAALGQ